MACALAQSNDEFWKECASWLTRWGILRGDHKANWVDATIVDLANTLRDGVLLCTLLSKIDPKCIDIKDVNLKPAMARFLCQRNIGLFLQVCRSSYGLSEGDLFDDVMLFDLVNFHKVLCTLSKLSMTKKALKCNILGFSTQNENRGENEDIYQSLSFEPPVYNGLDTVEYATYYDEDNEDTYQMLMKVPVRDLRNEVNVSEPMEKRDFVIKELVDTEKNYVEVLSKLKKNFMLKLTNMMKPEVVSVIFHKIPELYDIHKSFLSQLHKMSDKSSEKRVRLSSVFMHHKEDFLMYGEYCANLSTACTALQEICDKDLEVCNIIERLEKQDNNGKFKLRDVLSVPMQRVLKYHLLLEKLIEFTEPKNEEYAELKTAREAMLDVAGYINEYARDREQVSVINAIRDNITEWDCPLKLDQCGKLIKDGEIRIKHHDDGKVRNRYVFIFQKCMILCKSLKDNKFAYRDMFNLSDFQIEVSHNRAALSQNARWSYQWHLVKCGKSTAYTCSVRSIQLKDQMLKALRECMDNLKPVACLKTTHKYEMHSFDRPTTCVRCSKYLKGLIFQGYKCRDCNVGVHKECILASGNCGMPASPPPCLPPPHPPHYGDEALKDKLWFVGEMDRQLASTKLQNRPNGTFLVRVRRQSDDHDRYALSLKTDGTVKHMKICSNIESSGEKYFLSPATYFNSIEKLVENYQLNSLKESFERLQEDTRLEWPYKTMRVVAKHDFESSDMKHLPLRNGHEFIVIGQEGYKDGWWKGSSNINGRSRVGFFPYAYVDVLEVLHNY